MKKISGFLLIIIGAIMVIISIMGLVKAFDVFTALGTGAESIGYVFGSIIIPLLMTVSGRWIFRKGMGMVRAQ